MFKYPVSENIYSRDDTSEIKFLIKAYINPLDFMTLTLKDNALLNLEEYNWAGTYYDRVSKI